MACWPSMSMQAGHFHGNDGLVGHGYEGPGPRFRREDGVSRGCRYAGMAMAERPWSGGPASWQCSDCRYRIGFMLGALPLNIKRAGIIRARFLALLVVVILSVAIIAVGFSSLGQTGIPRRTLFTESRQRRTTTLRFLRSNSSALSTDSPVHYLAIAIKTAVKARAGSRLLIRRPPSLTLDSTLS